MRIVAGRLRRRPLAAPIGQATRPTADRTRQAMFNVLEHAPWAPAIEGARVLDLFAGSGALGLEALSRGAAFCLFVERDAAALAAIRANVAALDLADRAHIERRDATALGTRAAGEGAPFDLAFLDPPYGTGLAARSLAQVAGGGWLNTGAVVVVERGARDPATTIEGLEPLAERSWGAARVSFLRRL